jgi:hypothetical protein
MLDWRVGAHTTYRVVHVEAVQYRESSRAAGHRSAEMECYLKQGESALCLVSLRSLSLLPPRSP